MRNEKAVRLTEDHSLVAQLVAQGKLTPEAALGHPLANAVTRFVGIEPIEVDVAVHAAEPGDVYVLCTDGAACVPPEDLAKLCGDRARRAACRLVDEAVVRDGKDNVAAIVVRVTR